MASYEFRHEAASVTRSAVTVSQVPPDFIKALDAQWKIVQEKNVIPVIDFADAKAAAHHLAYAKAWGLSKADGEKVTVTRASNGKNHGEGTLRLKMVKFDPNAPKRGRRAANPAG